MSDSFDLSEQFPPSPDRRGAALATLKKARDDYKTGDTPVRNYVHQARPGPTTQAQVDIQTTPERILHNYHCSTSHQRREPRCSRHLPARLNAIPKTPYSPARTLLVCRLLLVTLASLHSTGPTTPPQARDGSDDASRTELARRGTMHLTHTTVRSRTPRPAAYLTLPMQTETTMLTHMPLRPQTPKLALLHPPLKTLPQYLTIWRKSGWCMNAGPRCQRTPLRCTERLSSCTKPSAGACTPCGAVSCNLVYIGCGAYADFRPRGPLRRLGCAVAHGEPA